MNRVSRAPRLGFVVAVLGVVLLGGGAGAGSPGASRSPRTSIAFVRMSAGHWQVWRMDVDGKNQRQLTFSPVDKHGPSWCPGNTVLHYDTALGVSALFDLRTGREHIHLPETAVDAPPAGPDGQPLPFDVDVGLLLQRKGFRGSSPRVGCGDPNGDEAVTTEIRAPELMPEGSALAVRRRRSQRSNERYAIERVQLQGVQRGQPVGSSRNAQDRRVVSGRGSLAFVSHRTGEPELRVLGGGRTQATSIAGTLGDVANPAWSPDGRWLLFDSARDGIRQIFRVDRRGRRIERLTDGAPCRSPAFTSQDGPPLGAPRPGDPGPSRR